MRVNNNGIGNVFLGKEKVWNKQLKILNKNHINGVFKLKEMAIFI